MVLYFKAVRKVSDMMLAESKGQFEPIEATCDGGEVYALRCGKKIYLYVYNPFDKPVTSITIKCGKGKASGFNFDTLAFSRVSSHVSKGNVVIPCSIPRLGEALYVIK